MDWIDEQYEKILKKVGNMGLFSGAVCYFLFFGALAFLLSFLTVRICDRKMVMWLRGTLEADSFQTGLWSFLIHWCSYIYLALCTIVMLYTFYRRRLRKPLAIIKRGVEELEKQNLEFSVVYDSRDEMGQLCASFEKMRKIMAQNYGMLCKQVENQKQLNAAFAHDLRTPLTVLKGYSEFLARYLPQGMVSQEKMGEILSLMTKQLERLTSFSMTMKKVRSLDEVPVEREKTELFHFYHMTKGILEALNLGGDLEISIEELPEEKGKQQGMLDENLVLEVLDNLLSNAIRYARSRIWVTIDAEGKGENRLLLLYVEDDGPGFSKDDLEKALRPYYGQEQEGEHFGIGLYICAKLCKACGGTFSIANRLEKPGAIASASFRIS